MDRTVLKYKSNYPFEKIDTKNFPVLPENSITILNTVNNPDVSINELIEALITSPTLVARLLGLANASFYGSRAQVTELHKAIVQVLGLNLVKSLAIAFTLNGQLNTKKCPAFNSGYHWSHSLTTAILAQKISMNMRQTINTPIIAYTSGLLVNIGILAAVFLFPEKMNEMFILHEKSNKPLSALINDHFGLNEYKIGFQLLQKWGLPLVYQNTLKEFSSPDYQGEEKQLIVITRLSQELSKSITGDSLDLSNLMDMIESLSLDAKSMNKIVTEVIENKNSIGEMVSILSA